MDLALPFRPENVMIGMEIELWAVYPVDE